MQIGQDATLYRDGKKIRVLFREFDERIRGKISGMVQLQAGEYTILVDTAATPQKQRLTVGHELAHVLRGHLAAGVAVDDAERDASRHAWEFYRIFRDYH